ncbi:MAG: hypothetical protein NTZ78_06490 [Candidatus Aureabacteria bacterium]|nr:hypothetical protein [Candidatus Auribacterota bacterium]
MKNYYWIMALTFAVLAPRAIFSEEEITGDKHQAFRVSPDKYLDRAIVLEDTFEKVAEHFNRMEIDNYYNPGQYVKFFVGQSPYPCIGMRLPSVEDALDKCSRGDLLRVHGTLKTIMEKRMKETVRGKSLGGAAWEEHVYVYGPRESELIFLVTRVERGWGKGDSPEEMFAEGTNLKEEHYQEIPPEQIAGEGVKLIERSVWFEGEFGGISENFTDLEKAAGTAPDKVIKFSVKGCRVLCYVPFNDANLAGFRAIPSGNKVQVYGRVRMKETPKGEFTGFFVDRLTKTVSKASATPTAGTGAGAR